MVHGVAIDCTNSSTKKKLAIVLVFSNSQETQNGRNYGSQIYGSEFPIHIL